jgi:hypothetical protein
MVILSTGTPGNAHAAFCWATQRDYAARIGASYQILSLESGRDGLATAFAFLAQLPPNTRCLLLEWDIEVMPDAPSIFDEVPNEDFNLRPHLYFHDFYNLGVMLGRATHFARLAEILPTLHGGTNRWEFLFRIATRKVGFPIAPLPIEWNSPPDREGYFIHHAGDAPATPRPGLGDPAAA